VAILNKNPTNKFARGDTSCSYRPSEISVLSDVYDDSMFTRQLIALVNIASQHDPKLIDQKTVSIGYIGAKNRLSHVSTEEVA
jgi:hypothetical protein